MSDNLPVPGGEFLPYAIEDGRTRLSVRVQDGTVWLSQAAIAELFLTTKRNVSLHLQNIYEDEELRPEATVKQYLTVQTEGGRQVRRVIDHYNNIIKPCRSWPRGSCTRRRGGEKIRTPALTSQQIRKIISGLIDNRLKANVPSSLCRRSTRWLRRCEQARLYHHRSRKVTPRLKNQLRT